MPNITEKRLDENAVEVTICVTAQEYKKDFNKAIADLQKRGTFKGFRQGKAPMSFILKMFGKETLAKMLNDMLGDAMVKHLEGREPLHAPVPFEEAELDIKTMPDYTFTFRFLEAPADDLQGLEEDRIWDFYKITVNDEQLDAVVQDIIENNKKPDEDADFVKDIKDVLNVTLREMGEEDVKADGIVSETMISVDLVAEPLRSTLIGMAKGQRFEANYADLSTELNEDRQKEYLLKLNKDENGEFPAFNEIFEVEINSIRTLVRELDATFFADVLGKEGVETMEAFREEVRLILEEQLEEQSDDYFMNSVYLTLLEENNFTFSKEVVARLMQDYKEKDDKATDTEQLTTNTVAQFKWEAVSRKLKAKFDIEVLEEHTFEATRKKTLELFGRTDDMFVQLLLDMVNKEDDEATPNQFKRVKFDIEVLADKMAITEALKSNLKTQSIEISRQNFDLKMSEINDKLNTFYGVKNSEELPEGTFITELPEDFEVEVFEETTVEEVETTEEIKETTDEA
jgi:FKBP-type peptidyl-prolyl cis-trans isomerase (trigger factor)